MRDTVVVDIDRVSGVQPRGSTCAVLPGGVLSTDILLQISDEVCRRGEKRVVLQVSGGGEELRDNRGPDERFLPLSVFHTRLVVKRGKRERQTSVLKQSTSLPNTFLSMGHMLSKH